MLFHKKASRWFISEKILSCIPTFENATQEGLFIQRIPSLYLGPIPILATKAMATLIDKRKLMVNIFLFRQKGRMLAIHNQCICFFDLYIENMQAHTHIHTYTPKYFHEYK